MARTVQARPVEIEGRITSIRQMVHSCNLELSIDRRVDGEIWGINEAISKILRQLIERE